MISGVRIPFHPEHVASRGRDDRTVTVHQRGERLYLAPRAATVVAVVDERAAKVQEAPVRRGREVGLAAVTGLLDDPPHGLRVPVIARRRALAVVDSGVGRR
jgi:hypothetical protein